MAGFNKRLILLVVTLSTTTISCTNDKLDVLECENGQIETCGDKTLLLLDGVGVCNISKRRCEQGVWLSCSNDDSFPEDETCDGLDNDCNGIIDDDVIGQGLECGLENQNDLIINPRSICKHGMTQCIKDGNAYYVSCEGTIGPRDETCNNIDDDCDGVVDEPEDMAIKPCYTLGLDSDYLRHGICHMGIIECRSGIQICINEQLPRPETCDQFDNNCDGRINEELDINDEYDFVFILDESGSMSGIITMLGNAMIQFTSSYTDTKFRWALVGAPYSEFEYDGKVTLLTDLTDVMTFAEVVRSQVPSRSNAYEPTFTAIAQISDLTNNPLGLSWRTSSKKIIVLFTNEDGQHDPLESPASTEMSAANMAAGHGVQVFAFIDTAVSWDSFDDITQATDGQMFDINTWSQTIIDNMHGIIKMSCEN